jgi:pyruvate dehydrogenase E2 component (dihydrolipoamide acetyltransferase)
MTAILVPDIGDVTNVTVIEVTVETGDTINEGDTLIVLETDKASMEIPANVSGIVGQIHVKEGSEVNEGDPICDLEVEVGSEAAKVVSAIEKQEPLESLELVQPPLAQVSDSVMEQVIVPDTGSTDGVTVIEVAVSVGDQVNEGDTLIVLESDKASMEIPSPVSGEIAALFVKEGDVVVQADAVADVSVTRVADDLLDTKSEASPQPVQEIQKSNTAVTIPLEGQSVVHAGPAVRALARELGVELIQVSGTGSRERITKDDLHEFVKAKLNQVQTGPSGVITGPGIPSIPLVDFESFGPVERIPMSKIHKLTADNMTRCWLNVPAVTQFDEADITDLETFRKSMKSESELKGIKLTPLPFFIKASAYVLRALPQINSSVDLQTDEIVRKGYVHIGIAVDTPGGLMVPVIRDADKKGMWEIAAELSELADKAKSKKLKSDEMQGATFTISSLGSIGGTAFTPIVPSPQAAILGVSKASMQPIWDGSAFQPRLMLPLCLSYDHRVINGGDGARFTALLGQMLGDIRKLLL